MCEHDTTAEHSNISPTGLPPACQLVLVSTSSLFETNEQRTNRQHLWPLHFLRADMMVPPIVSERYCSALERASNLAIDINPTALPAARRRIRVPTEWLAMLRQLQSVHNQDPKVQPSPLKSHLLSCQQPPVGHRGGTVYVCWLQTLCSWREADVGNL